MAEMKQSPHVTEKPKSSIRKQFSQQKVMCFVVLTRVRRHLLTVWVDMELVPNLCVAEGTGSGRVHMHM